MRSLCAESGEPCLSWPAILLALIFVTDAPAAGKKCLFVSSYHKGYAWSDGVERGLRRTLAGECSIRQFDMDTKRKKRVADKEAAANAARKLIAEWQPDVVITADDAAARYLIQPYFKDHDLPFVFCGVNWTVKEYGFPYRNVTGMIEVAPVAAMISEATSLVKNASRVLYIGANTSTERKNASRIRKVAEGAGLVFDQQLASSSNSWIGAYTLGQEYDFIIIGSNAGINDWDTAKVVAAIEPVTQRLTVTSHEWMMPVTMLGMTKVPEEQGEWAAKVVLQIFKGSQPDSIPVIANRKWDLFLNTGLVERAGMVLPTHLVNKGKVSR